MQIDILQARPGYYGLEGDFISGPNSIGGVSVEIKFICRTQKPIEQITFCCEPYDEEGTPVVCTVRGVSAYGLVCSGVYESGRAYAISGENMWYNRSIDTIGITGAHVKYTDGTEEPAPELHMVTAR